MSHLLSLVAFGIILVYTYKKQMLLRRIHMEILYKKIAQDIKEHIQSGRLKPDEKIPTENELSMDYGVSRITSKKALNILQEEGLIYRVRGSGSFVKKQKHPQHSPYEQGTIAVVLPFKEDDTYHGTTLSAIHSISKQVMKKGYHTTLLFSDHDTHKQNEILDKLYDDNYVGAIIYPIKTSYNESIYRLYAKHFPMVMMSNAIDRLDIPSATVDNVQGSYLATKHLINQGHHHILFLSYQHAEDNNSISDRYLGYLHALHEADIASNNILYFTDLHAEDQLNSKGLISIIREKGITGIVCVNDETASAFIRYGRQHDFICPKEYSIVGFDNLSLCQHTYPPLTTIQQDYGKLGEKAADLLIECIERGVTSLPSCVLEVTLVERESTQSIVQDQ